jgi:hypothetical protein
LSVLNVLSLRARDVFLLAAKGLSNGGEPVRLRSHHQNPPAHRPGQTGAPHPAPTGRLRPRTPSSRHLNKQQTTPGNCCGLRSD